MLLPGPTSRIGGSGSRLFGRDCCLSGGAMRIRGIGAHMFGRGARFCDAAAGIPGSRSPLIDSRPAHVAFDPRLPEASDACVV